MSTFRCLPFLALAAALGAQTAAPPDAPQVVVETVGPEGWRARLGPTNVGSLLASEPGQALWKPRLLPLLAMWQQLAGTEAAFTTSRDRALGYAGRVRIGVWTTPGQHGERDETETAVVVEGDGKSDLQALATDLQQLLHATMQGEWQPRDVGGAKLDVCDLGTEVACGPITNEKCLLIVTAGGEHLEQALARGRRFAAESTGKAPPLAMPALRATIDLPALLAAQDAAQPREHASRVAIGLDSLGALTFAVSAAGPHVQVEIDQHFRSDQRGLFGVLCSSNPELPHLLPLAETTKGSWHAGHLDLVQLHDTVLTALGADLRETPEQMRADVRKEIGIDLRDDLLVHAGDAMLFSLASLADLDSPRDVTWSLAFELKDAAAFGKAFWQMMPHAKPLLSRAETVDVDGVELHRYGNAMRYDLWVAVGNGIFVLGGGRDGEERATALLRAAKAMDRTQAPALSKAFATVQRAQPAGTNAASIADLDALLAMPLDWSLQLLGEVVHVPGVGDEAPAPEDVARARAVLRENHLDTVRSLTGYADGHFRWRVFW